MLVIIGVEDSNSLSKWLYHTSARDKATFVLESNNSVHPESPSRACNWRRQHDIFVTLFGQNGRVGSFSLADHRYEKDLFHIHNRRNLKGNLHISEHLITKPLILPFKEDFTKLHGQSSGELSTKPSTSQDSQPSNCCCKTVGVAADAFLTGKGGRPKRSSPYAKRSHSCRACSKHWIPLPQRKSSFS